MSTALTTVAERKAAGVPYYTVPPWIGETELNAQILCDQLTHGVGIASICRAFGWPPISVHAWIARDPIMAQRAELARQIGAHKIDCDIIDIADGTHESQLGKPPESPEVRKLRVAVREKRRANWHNTVYGEKARQVDVRTVNVNVDISADPQEAARQYQEIMRSG